MDTAITQRAIALAWNHSEFSLFELSNAVGTKVLISDLGATLVSLQTHNRDGVLGEILLGYDTPEEYLKSGRYLGASVGRVANRIEGARFSLDGTEYRLPANSGEHCSHGGPTGFHHQKWQLCSHQAQELVLSLVSPDGDNGFPGEVQVKATFRLTDDNALTIVYDAVSDQATPINLTSHGYFNLSDNESTILNHRIQIAADAYLAVNDKLIPDFRIPVVDTAFDLNAEKSVRAQLMCYEAQLFACGGFDHNFCLSSQDLRSMDASVYSPESGRKMALYTNLPGVQFYTANHFSGELGKGGKPLETHAGLCLEPQYPPNLINTDEAELCVLRPGKQYRAEMRFVFSTL